MPTLLQINSTCNYGSTGHIAEQIAERASKQGWESIIAHGGRYIMPSNFETIQISSSLDNKFHALKSIAMGMHGLGSTVSTQRFVDRIKQIKPDVIHLHNIHGYYINYSILFDFLSVANIPVIWTLHDCWAMTGQCTHYVSIGCERWKTGCYDCQLLKYGYKTLVDRSKTNWKEKQKSFSSVKRMTIVPVSQWLEGIVKESYLSQYPIKVIHNGIDLNVFKPKKVNRRDLGLDERITLLGVSSSWDNSKGLNEFIELSKNPSYQVVLIGVQEPIMSKLPKAIKAIKRTENLESLVQYYNAADIFVNPTRADSFPTVNLEALACGTPVLTYNTGGSPEAVNSNTGWVVEQGDVFGINKIIESFSEKTEKEVMNQRNNCRIRAEQEFNKEDCFDKYLDLYNLANEP